MKSPFITWALLAVVSARLAAAVDMSLYQPSAQVEPGFRDYLQELYAETEDPASTTSFTDFFAPNGSLIVLQYTAVGAERITGLKQALMPTDGSKLWQHVPNATDVFADTTSSKTYEVRGVIQTTYRGGDCSQAYYSTRFTVAKGSDEKPILAVRSGSLLSYDDYIVQPSVSPTEIPCHGGQEPGGDSAAQTEAEEVHAGREEL